MRSAGYPIVTFVTRRIADSSSGFNLGGTNASGQIPDMPGNWGLIDKDTPKDAYVYSSNQYSGQEWQLVFSDEFNTDGRSFYPGDDPYWEAVDLHYWQVRRLNKNPNRKKLTYVPIRQTT